MRYSLTSFLCLATGQDDDGNYASGHNPNNNNNYTYQKPNNNPQKPSEAQMKRYSTMLSKAEIKEEDLFNYYNSTTKRNINKNNMTLEDYDRITKYLQQRIDNKNSNSKN